MRRRLGRFLDVLSGRFERSTSNDMGTNELERWVEGRVAELGGEAFQPNPARALARFKERRARRRRGVRMWICAGAGAVAALVLALAFPAPRVLAGRCVDACGSLFVQRTGAGLRRGVEAPDFLLKDAAG